MDVGQEIAQQVEKLPPDMQERMLRFVPSLSPSAPAGEGGAGCALPSPRNRALNRLGIRKSHLGRGLRSVAR